MDPRKLFKQLTHAATHRKKDKNHSTLPTTTNTMLENAINTDEPNSENSNNPSKLIIYEEASSSWGDEETPINENSSELIKKLSTVYQSHLSSSQSQHPTENNGNVSLEECPIPTIKALPPIIPNTIIANEAPLSFKNKSLPKKPLPTPQTRTNPLAELPSNESANQTLSEKNNNIIEKNETPQEEFTTIFLEETKEILTLLPSEAKKKSAAKNIFSLFCCCCKVDNDDDEITLSNNPTLKINT